MTTSSFKISFSWSSHTQRRYFSLINCDSFPLPLSFFVLCHYHVRGKNFQWVRDEIWFIPVMIIFYSAFLLECEWVLGDGGAKWLLCLPFRWWMNGEWKRKEECKKYWIKHIFSELFVAPDVPHTRATQTSSLHCQETEKLKSKQWCFVRDYFHELE